MKEDISFESQGHKLIGTLYKAPGGKVAALLIAGGANTHRHEGYYPPWQEMLLDKGVTTFNFDFRGVGDSEGELNETNLDTRVEDALAALETLRQHPKTEDVYLVGVSMGAPIAIRIANSAIKGILLTVPAAYSLEARSKNFGPAFSEAVRKPESWRDSPDFKKLQEYNGRMFLLYADQDKIIPQEISTTFAEVVRSHGGRITVLENAGHRSWQDEQRDHSLVEMTDFIIE